MSHTIDRPKTYPRNPDYIIPIAPGEHLKEKLDEMEMTDTRFSELSGLPIEAVLLLYKGIIPVDAELAAKLEAITQIPTGLWLRFESGYREDLKKASEKYCLASTEFFRTTILPVLSTLCVLPTNCMEANVKFRLLSCPDLAKRKT